MVLTSPKALSTLSQLDLVLSSILFIVENLVPVPNSTIHIIILITSALSVSLSLAELYVLFKAQYYKLLATSLVRLGPMVALSIFWIIYSQNYQSHLSVGCICLAFQIIKGLWLLVASIDALHRQSKSQKMKYDVARKLVEIKQETNNDIPTICIQEDSTKNCWDPLEPAYDNHGKLRFSNTEQVKVSP